MEQLHKVQLLHVELEEKVVLRNQVLFLLDALALLIEVVEVEVEILLLQH